MTDWETRYYEAEANHTEANGMLTSENERLKRLHTDAFHEAERWKEREAEARRECDGMSHQLVLLQDQLAEKNNSLSDGAKWIPIESAPKDGRAILVLSAEYGDGAVVHSPQAFLAQWNPEGDSWVDEHGELGGDCVTLAVTGTWWSGTGWFQPNEVTHWLPIPEAPK